LPLLDTDTKRRIDTARDILVGKVPDPKSQVEQITIALIYKFMDDMDAEAEELGGKRKFFAGGYARYGWAKLMRAGLGGHEVLNLYAEAISKMPENPGIPLLFRNIFRNAYLPYRDPETLKSFLKIIDEFNYDHSERLGDAFEYLLSVLGSQGDAGQFRTPRHIIDFIVDIVDPKKNETILDPACGTAGFLISSYKHILRANTDKKGHVRLTPDERGRLAKNLKGYDISPDMVRLSLVNLYLHGFTDPHIDEYDTLTSEERWKETADVILANPPFMSPKGGIKPHRRFSVQSKRSEVLFVDYIAEHLSPTGRAGIIVPEGIIFQSQGTYRELRKMLVENHLVAVISLPAGVFNPYSGVKTSVLILDRVLARQSDTIGFFKVENDGYGLGAQRRSIDKNDLPRVKAELNAYFEALRNRQPTVEIKPVVGLLVSKNGIAANGDYSLTGERYREGRISTAKYPTVPIGEVCDLFNGRAFKTEDWKSAKSGGLPIVRIQNLNNPESSFNYFLGEVSERNLIEKGELLFSWSGSRGTSFGAHIWKGEKAVLNQHIFKVSFDAKRANKMFLLYALNKAVAEIEENLHGGVGLVHITKGNLERIKIPIPPLEVQEEIVEEIEGYQKVIDGARSVLDHYRPRIPFHPEWPVVPLGEVIEGKPKNGYSGSPVNHRTSLKVLALSATTSGELDLSKFKFLDEDIAPNSPCRCRRGDIYLQRGNTKELVGTAAIFDVENSDFIYPDLMIRIRADEKKIRSHYLLTILQSGPVREFVMRNAVGAAGSMPKINQGIVARIPVLLPPLPTQEEIVAEIEAEKSLVAANRELVARFENKIQATLARVWGESEVNLEEEAALVPMEA
jgi:type I restriction enzyme M protein